MKYGRGIQIVEDDLGKITAKYIEYSPLVFVSPIEIDMKFESWDSASNFLKLWSTLAHLQWWKDQRSND